MDAGKVKTGKTLVIAAICFPPVLIGPAVLMGNLFRHFPKGSYHVLMGRLDHVWPPIDQDSMLPEPYTFTRFPSLHSRGNWWRRMRSFLRDIFMILVVTWKGLRIMRREKIYTIFAVADHYVELAALLMCWLTGKKIVLYLPDLYYVPDSLKPGWTRVADRMIEPFLLRAVDTVLVTAEPTREYYRDKYGLETIVLPHSVDLNEYTASPKSIRQRNNVTHILFTGSVTQAQKGAIMDMVRIVNECPELHAKFIVVSNMPPSHLEEMGIAGPQVACKQANRKDIPALQQSANILFLPLVFASHSMTHQNIIRTASPSKLPEYLAAGRPILVYAPAESYYARYARKEGFGLVVDQPDTDLLRQSIFELQRDDGLRHRLTVNSHGTVTRHHDAVKVSAQLQDLLNRL